MYFELASVVAGLTDKPVIAVPTSVGYGAAFGGVAALLGITAPGDLDGRDLSDLILSR